MKLIQDPLNRGVINFRINFGWRRRERCRPPLRDRGVVNFMNFASGPALSSFARTLQSEAGAEIIIGGEAKCLQPGEAWQIDVGQVHSVRNDSRVDRIIILFDSHA